MAVALGTGTPTRSVSPATGSSVTSASWTISGTNLAIIVYIGLSSSTATVSSVTWSLGGKTPVEVKAVRNDPSYGSVWVIPAPVAGAGTYTVNLSASVPYQVSATYFTGVDQHTPCPLADAVSATGTGSASLTITPSNVGANDAAAGTGVSTVSGNPREITPNNTYLDTSTAVNLEAGYILGTGALTATWDSGSPGSTVKVAVGIRLVTARFASPPWGRQSRPQLYARKRVA